MRKAGKIILAFSLFILIIARGYAQGGAIYIKQEWQDGLGSLTFNPILNPFGYQW